MKARLEKKLSKRLVELAPQTFKDAWIDDEVSARAEEQGSSVSHVYSMSGEPDYWGEGTDYCSVWQWWNDIWPWDRDFPPYPQSHEFSGYPDLSGFKATTKNILALAVKRERELAKMSLIGFRDER